MRGKTQRTGMSFKKQMKLYGNLFWFYVPAVILVIIFNYVPMTGIIMAFKKNPNLLGSSSAIQGILDAEWVGLENFKKIFTNPEILQALKNTLIISLQKIVILFPIPIVMAICLNEMKGKFVKKTLQGVMYIPHFLSWITVSGIFITLLNYDTGLINNIISFFGFERRAFVTSNETFRGVLVVSAAWAFLGWNTIVYVSAITALDRDLIEAAKIDGASKWQQICHVTLPGIMPTIAVMFILRIGGIMDAGFDQVLAMYTPYIKETGDILGTYTYRLVREAGMLPQYALSTAVGLFNSVVGLVLVLTGKYIVFAVVMLIEAVFRIFRHSAKEGFLDYLKFDKAEFLWLVTCPVVLACASLIPEMAGWRWLVALKMPNVFGRYNDEKVFEIIVEIAAVILILIFVLPFFNLVAVAISRPGQTVNLLPKDIDFWGVKYAITDKDFLASFKNSIFITAVGTVGSVVVVALAAYPLSKPHMPLKRTMMMFFMIVMYFGGGMAPMIVLMNHLHLMDTIWAMIIPGWMSVYNMLLMKGFFESLPPELEEAAKMDGASNMYVFCKIVLPLAKPMVATIAFFQMVGYWNNYGSALLYISSRKDLYPVPNFIRNFMGMSPQSVSGLNPTLATYWNNVEKSYLLFSIIPIMCLYPFVFRFIKGGLATGAVKG